MTVADEKDQVTEAAEQAVTAEADGQANGAALPEAAETPDLATLTAERDSYLDQLKRSLAEFANYRRRVDQERAQARELATRDLLRALVPIVDDFQRALTVVPDELRNHPWVQGVHLIERKLVALLEREGVAPIEALGKPFDPGLHEAVATEPGSTQNIVVEVYQKGYRHGQHLLRPAMVKVGDKVEEPASSEENITAASTTEQPATDE